MSSTISRTVIVNGTPKATMAESLAILVAELGYSPTGVATALNGAFVAAGARIDTVLSNGDTIEILTARQGG